MSFGAPEYVSLFRIVHLTNSCFELDFLNSLSYKNRDRGVMESQLREKDMVNLL